LGFSPEVLDQSKTWLHQPQGLIILIRTTGSGKTSILYTSLPSVVTVENPVESVLWGITPTFFGFRF
jgi:type II secretory ATPase GspE/PulE/Tfp pilus assembly ATPase PilB-like protein